MAHRNDLTSVDFSRVYAIYAGNRKFLEDAWDEFCALTNLDESSMKTEDDQLFMHSVFSEWVLFDYDIHRGKTPLEKFVTWPPAGVGANVISTYAQAATTNFTSTFHVLGYDEMTHKATLENVADGLIYRVLDPNFLRDLSPEGPDGVPSGKVGGMLCARIMRIRGTWMFAGNLLSYTETEPTPEELALMRDTEDEHGDVFVEVVRTIYGRAPLSAADSMASGFSALSVAERDERLAAAQQEYAELQRGLELEAGWDELRQMIREEDGEGSPVTLMDSIVGQERIDAMGEDELVHTLRPIMAAWNLLPHDILNGLTPVEDYEARYPVEDWDDAIAEQQAAMAASAEKGEGTEE